MEVIGALRRRAVGGGFQKQRESRYPAGLLLHKEVDDEGVAEHGAEEGDESFVRRMDEVGVAIRGGFEAGDPAMRETFAQAFRADVGAPFE